MSAEREGYRINGNPASCSGCIFLEKNHKIDNYFCRRIGVNIKLVRECETGPVLRKTKPQSL